MAGREETISPRELEIFFRALLQSDFIVSACAESELDLIVTRILLSPPDIVEQVLSLEGFPAQEFVQRIMVRFRESREDFLRGLEEKKGTLTCESEYSTQVHFAILLGKLGIHGRSCMEEIQSYLDSHDNWLASIGAEIIQNAQPMYSENLLSGLFDEMERFGPNRFPYKTGEVLASYFMHDRALYDRVAHEYSTRRDTFREALLYTFTLIKDLPTMAVELIISSAASAADRVKDAAIIALGSCSGKNPAVTTILRDELQSPQWWRRGNATHSLAKLKVKDEATLKRIEELVFDLEPGDDWTVREAAIEALGDYGPDARGAVPSLVKVLHEELAAGLEEDTGYASLADLASTALGKIGDSSPMTVEILGEVIKKGSDRSAPAAITALGKFGEAARPVLSFIERYIALNDSINDEEKVLSYVEALEKIAGPGSPELLKYLKRLQKSEIGDIREYALQAAHEYTSHP